MDKKLEKRFTALGYAVFFIGVFSLAFMRIGLKSLGLSELLANGVLFVFAVIIGLFIWQYKQVKNAENEEKARKIAREEEIARENELRYRITPEKILNSFRKKEPEAYKQFIDIIDRPSWQRSPLDNLTISFMESAGMSQFSALEDARVFFENEEKDDSDEL